MTKKVMKQLIKEFLKEVNEEFLPYPNNMDTPQGASLMKKIADDREKEDDTAYVIGFRRGFKDARNDVPSYKNPYLAGDNPNLARGWKDGWRRGKGLLETLNLDPEDRDTIEGMLSMKKLHKDILIRDLDTFTDSYIVMALYTSTDETTPSGGHPLDKNYTMNHFTLRTLEKMVKDCKDFQKKYGRLCDLAGIDDEEAGKCFWLNRNGHGTGFQDIYDYRDPLDKQMQASELRRAAQSYGSYDLYLIDNGPEEGMIAGHPNK